MRAAEKYAIELHDEKSTKNLPSSDIDKESSAVDVMQSINKLWARDEDLLPILHSLFGDTDFNLADSLKRGMQTFRYFLPGLQSGTYCMQVCPNVKTCLSLIIVCI
jgi:hypothetical protein